MSRSRGLYVHENNEFRIGFINIDAFDTLLNCSGKAARTRALQPHQRFRARCRQTKAKLITFAPKFIFHIKTIAFSLFSLPDLGFQILATKSSLPDPGYQILATRYLLPQILVTRTWLQDSRCLILVTRSWLPYSGY